MKRFEVGKVYTYAKIYKTFQKNGFYMADIETMQVSLRKGETYYE